MGRSLLVVVDGDARVQRAIAANTPQTVTGDKIEVVPCTTARGALNACCALEPQCVLTELDLADVDGLWLTQALRTQASRVATVPIMMMSSTEDEAIRLRALRGGVDVFVSKPFLPVELVAQIRALIAMSSRLRAKDPARGGS